MILISILQGGELKFSDMWYHIQIHVESDGSRIQSEVRLTLEPISFPPESHSFWGFSITCQKLLTKGLRKQGDEGAFWQFLGLGLEASHSFHRT